MNARRAKHVHFGAGAFGLGFVTALMAKADRVSTHLVNRSKSELHRKLATEKQYLLRHHFATEGAAAPQADPIKTSIVCFEELLFLDDDVALADLFVQPQTMIVTTALKNGLDACTPLLRDLLNARADRLGTSHPLFLVPCENVLGPAFLDLARDLPAGVELVDCVVDRVCTGPTISAQQNRVCVEAEDYAQWVIESTASTRRLARTLAPLVELGVLQFVDNIGPYKKRKLWLVNGVHAVCALFALYANEPDLDVFFATDPGPAILKQVQLEMGILAVESAGLEYDEVTRFNETTARRFSTTPDQTSRVLSRFREESFLDFVRNLEPKIVEPALAYLRTGVDYFVPSLISHAMFICLALAAEGKFVSHDRPRVPCA